MKTSTATPRQDTVMIMASNVEVFCKAITKFQQNIKI